jgi:1-acyl-sn-glycerol-3-phosphate acyltransferase
VLLLANHECWFDPAFVTTPLQREVHYVARDSLFSYPFFGRLIHSLNAFPIRRGMNDVRAVKETIRRLRAGEAVCLFPEGTRSPDGRIHEFHSGVINLASRTNVPIVPVLIDGAFDAWPKTRTLPRCGHVRIVYGNPIQPAQSAGEPEVQARRLRNTVVEMRGQLRARLARILD